jgi:hypothetical protein
MYFKIANYYKQCAIVNNVILLFFQSFSFQFKLHLTKKMLTVLVIVQTYMPQHNMLQKKNVSIIYLRY